MLPVRDVPTQIVTGFLGTGKTTLILDAFAHRPPNERWAVLVNEFGEVGIDGALYGDLAVEEIPGGCICCTAGVALRFGLIRLLREQRPDRLFIEPTGLANPASVLDLLRQPGIRDAVQPVGTLCLVDPAHLAQPRYTSHDAWQAQLALADAVIATHWGQRDDAQRATFDATVDALWPPRLRGTTDGSYDPAWLTLPAEQREVEPTHGHGAHAAGWVFPRTWVWDPDALTAAVQQLVRPNPAAPEGLVRLKGLFRTPGRWLLVQATDATVQVRPALWRRDSRVDLVALGPLDGDKARDLLARARREGDA